MLYYILNIHNISRPIIHTYNIFLKYINASTIEIEYWLPLIGTFTCHYFDFFRRDCQRNRVKIDQPTAQLMAIWQYIANYLRISATPHRFKMLLCLGRWALLYTSTNALACVDILARIFATRTKVNPANVLGVLFARTHTSAHKFSELT